MSTQYDSNYNLQPVEQQALHEARPLEHTELVKDVVTLELRKFFEAQQSRYKFLNEIPNIDKYRIATKDGNVDRYVSSVEIMRNLPDINQKLPLLAITTATGRTKKFGIGSQYVDVVQEPPRVTTSPGPWNLPSGSQVLFKTGKGQTLITITEAYAVDLTKVKPAELVAAINAQSGRIQAFVQPGDTVSIRLKTPDLDLIQVLPVTAFDYTGTDGPPVNDFGFIVGDGFLPSGISMAGKNLDAAPILGLNGQSDDIYNSLRPPKHRHQTAKDLTLNIDIGADDDNQRTELTDLVSYFFELYMAETCFVFLGDPEKGQNWQIALKCELTLAGESEIPRGEGDNFSKIYINRLSVPVLSIDYVDRPAVRPTQISRKPLVLGGDR